MGSSASDPDASASDSNDGCQPSPKRALHHEPARCTVEEAVSKVHEEYHTRGQNARMRVDEWQLKKGHYSHPGPHGLENRR